MSRSWQALSRRRRRRRGRRLALLAAPLLLALLVPILWSTWSVQPELPLEPEDPRVAPQIGDVEPVPEISVAGAEEPTSPFALIAQPIPTPTSSRLPPATHTVREGESLLELADQYGLRPESILWANDLQNPDLIVVGQKLIIPPQDGLFYPVDPGESLFAIAQRYGLEVETVAEANGLSDPSTLPAGLQLFLPGARPMATRLARAATGSAAEAAGASPAAPDAPLPENLPDLLAAGWLKTLAPSGLYAASSRSSRRYAELPPGARLERIGDLEGRRLPVRDPGDGRSRQAMSGWIEVDDLEPTKPPGPRELPRSYPAATRMDITHNFVPYRSQLDGSPFAEANCGPTVIGMVLERYGIVVPQAKLRSQVLAAQGFGGNGTGTLMTALAQVASEYGLKTHGLREGDAISRWSLDEIRGELNVRRPVVTQVRYRALPGREGAAYYGDHYLVITGILDDGFIYNDPIDFDGTGWDRVISGERLERAMNASDSRYAHAAFSVSR
jgi:LysM repeat protein